jgi:hypothetical protein
VGRANKTSYIHEISFLEKQKGVGAYTSTPQNVKKIKKGKNF